MDLRDLGHRMLWTAVETFTGFVLAEPIIELLGGQLDVSYLHVAVGTTVASVAVVVKEYARKRLGARDA